RKNLGPSGATRVPRLRSGRGEVRPMTALDVAQARERGVIATELQEAWPILSPEERVAGLRVLTHAEAEDFLLALPARDQAEVILATSPGERRSWMRFLPPDDAADVIQAAPEEE